MTSRWILDVEANIFTTIEYKVNKKLIKKYPELFFTRDMSNDDLPENVFPTVYIFFSSRAVGQDLVGQTVNAIDCTMEIQVTSSKAQGYEVAKDVIYEVLDNALALGFSGSNMTPTYINMDSDVKRLIMRVSRVIGYDDVKSLIK